MSNAKKSAINKIKLDSDLHDVEIGCVERRRDFLRMMGLGFGGFVVGGLTACGGGNQESNLSDISFWEKTSNIFEKEDGRISLNVDVAKNKPITTLELLDSAALGNDSSLSEEGVASLQRRRIAKILNVDEENIAITRGANDGMNRVLLGTSWRQGDAVIVSDQEHPNTFNKLSILERFYGIEVHAVKIATGPRVLSSDIVRLFDEKIKFAFSRGSRIRYLIWSSPSYRTGTLLPISEMVYLAKKYGIKTVCDAAHLLGMMNINFRDTGVDFLCASGHKWQCASNSCGILFFNPDSVNNYFDLENLDSMAPFLKNGDEHKNLASRLSAPIVNNAINEEFIHSCFIWNDIGRGRIEEYIRNLGKYTRNKIIDIWGEDALYSPVQSEYLQSGIIAFNPFFDSKDVLDENISNTFVRDLREKYAVDLRNVEVPSGSTGFPHWPIRLSTHIWLSPSDIDTALLAMRELAKKK